MDQTKYIVMMTPEGCSKIVNFMTLGIGVPDASPFPGGHEIYNFVKPFFGHHYFIPSLSESFPD